LFAVIGANNECYFNDNSFSSVENALSLAIESFGLNAMFTSNVTEGPPQLGVQFQSMCTPGTGIESWEWDLDGDGSIDSTEEDPYYPYSELGSYDVTLTVTMDGETSTLTNADYITVTDGSDISGCVSGIWGAETNPFNITGDITIDAGSMLEIYPGVTINFENGTSFNVYGKLETQFPIDEDEPIILTSTSSWGGIEINDSQEANIIQNCEISKADGSAITIKNDSYVDVIGNKIFENTSSSLGAAIDVDASDNVVISQNIIANNTSTNLVGGIGAIASAIEISNNVIVNNTGTYGALSLKNGSDALIMNNTIANNLSNNASSYLFFLFNAMPTYVNNIVIDNGDIFFAPFGMPEITYSCVTGGFTGTGNIDEDPLFMVPSEGDGAEYDGLAACWMLGEGSLAIDAGNPDAMYNDPDGSRNDMGAYGGPNALIAPVGASNDPLTVVSSSINAYPNPFNPQTSIALNMTETDKLSPISVGIYNVRGQLVKTLINDEIVTNSTFVWNGTDSNGNNTATGMYLVKVKTASTEIGKKILLLK
jgi:PKD repeat protein